MKQIIGAKKEIKRIAEAYVNAKDDLPGIPIHSRILLQRIINNMFSQISKEFVHFDFVKKDPYKYDTVKPMRFDYEHTQHIKINVSGNNSILWGPVYNLMFRAIHDFIHVNGSLDFNYTAEVNAYHQQINWTVSHKHLAESNVNMALYERVLRSEIVYQAAYKTHFGKFHVPVQKIILKDL